MLKKVKKFLSHTSTEIIIIYNLTLIVIAIIFFPLVPKILSYAPGVFEQGYETKWFGISYAQQYIIFITLILLISIFYLRKILKDIDNWEASLKYNESNKSDKIHLLREKCLNIPYYIYFVQIILPIVVVLCIHLITIMLSKSPIFIMLKLLVLLFSFVNLAAVVSLLFSKRVFRKVLVGTYYKDQLEGVRIGIKNKVIIQILPLFIIAILFTSLIGYSKLIEEKGDLLFKYYKSQMADVFSKISYVNNIHQIDNLLMHVNLENFNGSRFIIAPDGSTTILKGTSPLSKAFYNYIRDLSPSYDGRIYDLTAETQGIAIRLKGNNGYWVAGIKYEVASTGAIMFFVISFISLLGINIFVLYYFSKTLSDDISLVATSLSQIATGKNVDLDQKLPVISNDEIGDLVIAFNKIQEREKEHIHSIIENQNMIRERARLASLGQMIGGIAHNLKSPIMSLAGGIEALKDLVKEYDESVDDHSVTTEDHHQIAGEMLSWLNEMRPYCTYMSDIITAVKDQAVQLNDSSSASFTMNELVKRVEILMKYELKKYNCTINLDLQTDFDIQIYGEINNLVQVFNNLIINAIQAYGGQGGRIDFRVNADEKKVEFQVSDSGAGIPAEIRERLFKEMVTTKGAKGTGLGLYMSHLTIKGRFGGQMWFESQEGQGTTFYISIPYKIDT